METEPKPGNAARPANAEQAVSLLDSGSARYAAQCGGSIHAGSGTVPSQVPFAAAVGCADARVPVELVLGCGANEIFETRVAGNVPGPDVLGSLEYAAAHLPTVQLAVSLGHSSCGAVTTAVEAWLDPAAYVALSGTPQLRDVVERLLGPVRLAAEALQDGYGEHVAAEAWYPGALLEVATTANAAVTAQVLAANLGMPVVFGVYDLVTCRVGIPGPNGTELGLKTAPGDADELRRLLQGSVRGGAGRWAV